MSADNWAQCPQCRKNKEVEYVKAYTYAGTQIGKVSATQYTDLLIVAKNIKDGIGREATLAEYFTIGIDEDEEFIVTYSAHCTVCGFNYNFGVKNELELK